MFKPDENFARRFVAFARLFIESRGTNHQALRSLRFMKHQARLTSDLYRVWIDTLAHAGDRMELRTVLEEMRKCGVNAEHSHYQRLMRAMSGFREFRECEAIARDMKAQRITPSPELLDLLRGNPELAQALEILRKESTTPGIQATPSTTRPNATQGNPDATHRTPNATHGSPAIPGTRSTAQGIPSALYNAFVAKLNPQPISNPSTSATQAAQPKPDVAQTTQAAPDATQAEDDPGDATFVEYLKKAIKNATQKECDEILRELRSKYANLALYNTVISRAPNKRIAWQVLNGMVAHGIRPSVFTFNALLRYSAQDGIKGCMDVLSTMKAHGVSPDVVTYNQLMQLRLEENDKKGFLAFWEMMQKKQVQPTITTYNQILHLAKKLRDREWYYKAREELQKSGLEINSATRQLLLEPEDPNYWRN